MAAQLFYMPFLPVPSQRGLPAGGAKLYFFATGTTSFAPVYSDSDLTTALPNPVPADAFGRLPNIYLDSTLVYRVRAVDVLGGQIGSDLDPYYPGQAITIVPSLPQLIAPGGSALVGYRNGSDGLSITVEDKLNRIVNVTDFGTDVTAIKKARDRLVSLGGGVLNMPGDTYQLASAQLSSPILIPDNVVVEGNGSILQVTGSSVIGSIFRTVNASNVIFRRILGVGNGLGLADASSGALLNVLQDANGNGMENIRVEQVRMQNFGAERWISVLNQSTSGKTIRGVRMIDVAAISQVGNSLQPSNIAVGADAIMVFGVSADILDVEITGFYAEADFIKRGINIFHRVKGVRIVKPRIINAGQAGATDDAGAYAINAYGDYGELTDVVIEQPVITGPRSCGIYGRGVQRMTVSNPSISGQTDTSVTTLPKGAITFNGSTSVKVLGGNLWGNAFDLSFVANVTTTDCDFLALGVTTRGASVTSVIGNPATGPGSPRGFKVIGCDIDSNGNGVVLSNNQSGSGRNFADFLVSTSVLIARSGNAIDVNPNLGATMSRYRVFHNAISGSNRALNADNADGDLQTLGNTYSDPSTSAMQYGIAARNVPQLHMSNETFQNQGNGYATFTDGARGTVRNFRMLNVTNGYSPGSLGMAAPTFSATDGDEVQNLARAEAGAAGSKYVVDKWSRVGGAWLAQRMLTGN